ncbi:hypothetical protein JFU47_02785 [Pseudomonas sp. TH39(2020)]|uniref:hypothetical protein n=1 Tax=Pseudomonas sp. TH39(2020) TaxID=2796349 RepID=UPI001913E0DC|nr:hypothetical protein [Pseudomonas sp. TH39(2020)]MBK5395667.1 hypothetical protein [Pseudomonas sp. TH39(2020)]
MNVKANMGGGILAVTPVIDGLTADRRFTYEQLRVARTFTVQLTTITDPNSASVELHFFTEATLPAAPNFDDTNKSSRVGNPKLLVDQPGGVWPAIIEFTVSLDDRVGDRTDSPTLGALMVDRFHATGDYAPYYFGFAVYDEFENPDTTAVANFVRPLVDLTAPYQAQPGRGNGTGTRPALATVPNVIINDAWLADPANAGGLNVPVPTAYTKFEAGLDFINFYISLRTTFALMQSELPAFSGVLPASGIINISLAFLRGLPEGTHYYAYNLRDLPGNISSNSPITTMFQVVKAPAPVLAAPRIPVTGADGLTPITFATVRDPAPSRVVMEIDFPLNSLPGDRIVPHLRSDFDDVFLPEQMIPPVGTPGPLRFVLDYENVLAPLFGDPNSADEVLIDYTYELVRSTIPVPPVSPVRTATLEFAYAGPEQPNLPGEDNINIPPVVVQGAGTPTPAPNTLGPQQALLNATMTWPLWLADPARPVTGREIVTFYYQDKQVGAPIPVRAGDAEVTTTLPWATILAENNGTGVNARKAYVTVGFPGGANPMKQAVATNVDVTAIVINLPVPQIIVSGFGTTPERVGTVLNCPSLNHQLTAGPRPPATYEPRALRIRVRRDTNIPTGATVNLRFEGQTTNTVGAPVIPNTLIEASLPMPATGDLEFRLTNYAAMREIQLPPTGNPPTRPATRYARIAYTVNGTESSVIVPVALLNSSLVYCEIERPEVP